MEGRLMIALALMGAIIFGMPYFYKWISPQSVAQKKTETPAASNRPAEARATGTGFCAGSPSAETPAAVSAPAEQTVVIDTKIYRVELSTAAEWCVVGSSKPTKTTAASWSNW